MIAQGRLAGRFNKMIDRARWSLAQRVGSNQSGLRGASNGQSSNRASARSARVALMSIVDKRGPF